MGGRLLPLLTTAAAGVAVAACGGGGRQDWTAQLKSVNGSGVGGQARFTRRGEQVDVAVDARGLAADRVHQLELHAASPGSSRCPTRTADDDGDGLVTAGEARAALGRTLFGLRPAPTVGGRGRLRFRMIYLTRRDKVGEEPTYPSYLIDPREVLPLEGRTVVVYGLQRARGAYLRRVPVACGVIRRGGPGAKVAPGTPSR